MFKFVSQFVVGIVLVSFVSVTNAGAQEFNELTLIQLERQLNAILKTRLAEERVYIATIIKLVEEEKIPRRFLNVSFKYVTKRRPEAKNRFVYFVRVLQFLGAREKVTIPNFDFSIYSVNARRR